MGERSGTELMSIRGSRGEGREVITCRCCRLHIKGHRTPRAAAVPIRCFRFEVDLAETGLGCLHWFRLAQDRDQRRALVNAVMKVLLHNILRDSTLFVSVPPSVISLRLCTPKVIA
jgi:hypothetical protein